MQKVVGSNPISRFQESPAFAGLFALFGRRIEPCVRAIFGTYCPFIV